MTWFDRNVLWYIFPKMCASCGKIIRRFEDLCPECAKTIEKIKKPCLDCGADEKECMCKYYVYRFRGCIGAYKKGDVSMRVLYSFKLGDDFRVADFLADKMHEKFLENFSEIKFDAITAVPMRPFKKFTKSYNHSEVLAKKLSKRTGIPYKNLLKTTSKANKSQHLLSREERFANVRGMYKAKEFENIKTVLLVDDIKTTGASLNECTKQLMVAGAEDVYCAVAIVNGKSS